MEIRSKGRHDKGNNILDESSDSGDESSLPYSPVRHMTGILFPRDARKKCMAIISAYLDETGDADDPAQFVAGMGGLIGDEDNWLAFERKWKKALVKAKVPLYKDASEPYFHMREFVFRNETFKSWKGQNIKCDKLYDKLLRIIESSGLVPFGSMMPLQAWRGLSKKQQGHFISPYYFSAQDCAWMIASIEPNSPDKGQIAVIFSDKQKVKQNVRALFDVLRDNDKMLRERIYDPNFLPMRKFAPLQAADVIAYQLNQEQKRRLYAPDQPQAKDYLRMVKAQTRHVSRSDDLFYFRTEGDVRKLVDKIDKPHRFLFFPPCNKSLLDAGDTISGVRTVSD